MKIDNVKDNEQITLFFTLLNHQLHVVDAAINIKRSASDKAIILRG